MNEFATGWSRRRFLAAGTVTAGAAIARPRALWAADPAGLDARVPRIVATTFGIDTHNHIDVPMTADALPGADIDLAGELRRSGLAAICMTFATDYQRGDPYARFTTAMAAMDRQLARNGMKRALSVTDVRNAHRAGQPTVIQAVEGAHFLEGRLERVAEAYSRGMRHFGLLHDSDASVPLGDVYTHPPVFGGLTPFGAAVVKECNRLGMLIDLAHADRETTAAALKLSKKPVLISHTGLDTQLGNDPRMAQMMRPRLIGREQATEVARAGGLVGVWTHLADTPLAFAQNLRAMADAIGVDHVCIGTDTKLTEPLRLPVNFGPGGPQGPLPPRPPAAATGPQGAAGGPPHAHAGERTNEAWAGETAGFYSTVVDAMLKTGFTPDEIGRIGGGNYLRVFAQAVAP